MTSRSCLLLATALACLAAPGWAAPLQVGSGNEAVIEPPVGHPDETPCEVPLVIKGTFQGSGFTSPYSYAPPAGCPGPWAKVVLKMQFSLDQGRQFDRSGYLFMGGVPLWFGTTAEPRATLAPRWSFEKDVTDYTALFLSAQTGILQIPNYTSPVYTSVITASATLQFYPATASAPASLTADMVLPLPAGTGNVVTLNTGSDTLSLSANLPTNILHATLDLYLQGQSTDEFWYLNVPSDVAGELDANGNTAFREGQVSIDGVPAGVAPIYPWIFTGGIDPYLWQPIPGVQTFDFTAFHADLSPFAAVLSNGAQHVVAVSVYNANSYFSATGALRLFLDHAATQVTGGVTRNTLGAANPAVVENLTTANGATTGTIRTRSAHDFTISGTVTGSAGTMVNTLKQTTRFTNDQTFNVSATTDDQSAVQATDTTIASSSTAAGSDTVRTETLHYPLSVSYRFQTGKRGNSTQVTKVDQQFLDDVLTERDGTPVAQDELTDAIRTQDTLFFNSGFQVTGHKSQSETAAYARTGTSAPCFKRTLVSTFNVLTSVETGC